MQTSVAEILTKIEAVLADPKLSQKEMDKQIKDILKKAPKKIAKIVEDVLKAVECRPLPTTTAAPETAAPETAAPETAAPETAAPVIITSEEPLSSVAL